MREGGCHGVGVCCAGCVCCMARPVKARNRYLFFSFRADSACYHVGVGECLRPRLAYRRYLSFFVCMCFCFLADVNLDQNEVCHKQTQVWSVQDWVYMCLH